MEKTIPCKFDTASIYSPITPAYRTFPNIGITRIRAFYKGKNRNGSYITDAVAEQIIASAPCKPIVGEYVVEMGDYKGHEGPERVHAYGFVRENPNFQWERHLDTDGVEREYACFDAILFVEYFQEANKIVGCGQSMELNPATITGDWKMIDDEEYYVYDSASLLGFCVLGGSHEPCFEGSTFFSYEAGIQEMRTLVYDLMRRVEEIEKGGTPLMEDNKNIFGLENDLFEKLYDAINAEKGEQPAEYIYSIDENSCMTFDCVNSKIRKYVFDVSAENTEVSMEEEFSFIEGKEMSQTIADFEAKNAEVSNEIAAKDATIEELNTQIADFSTKLEENQNSIASLNDTIASLNEKIADYERRIDAFELARKHTLISTYETSVSNEDMEAIQANIHDFSYEELETKLALAFAHNNLKKGNDAPIVPIINEEETDVARFMKKYRK